MIIVMKALLKNWSRNRGIARVLAIGFAVAIVLSGAACAPHATPPPPKPPSVPVLRVRHQVGGTHYRTVVHQGVWYQTYGSSLLVVDPANAGVNKEIKLGKLGEIGPAIDLAAANGRLYVVIEDDAVCELAIDDPMNPLLLGRRTAEQMGIAPRTLSVVEGEVFASGRGGVVSMNDGRKFFSTNDVAGRVARSEAGLVVCIGRQVISMNSGQFVGSATDLQEISAGMPRAGELIFTRQNDSGALVGLMTPAIREVNTNLGTVGVPDTARAVRIFTGQVWVINDTGVTSYDIRDQALVLAQHINVIGARDVAPLSESDLAIAGSFGRAIYHLMREDLVAGEGFTAVVREAGRLDSAITDGRHVLAGSAEGIWMYLINSRAELVTQSMKSTPPPSQQAATVDGQARIVDDGQAVVLTRANMPELRHSEPDGAVIRCVAAIDGDFWLGTDRGIAVIRGQPMALVGGKKPSDKNALSIDPVDGRVRIAGPVTYIYPLLVGGGASYVSRYGGFGVVQFVDEPIGAVNPTR